MQMPSLFRNAAIRTHRHRLLGDVILSQPKTFAITTIFLGLVTVSLFVFITIGSYARKETVSGLLVPEKGIVQVRPPLSGIVDQLFAREGQYVQEGSALASISREHPGNDGLYVNRELLTQVATQLQEKNHQRSLETVRLERDLNRLAEEIAGLREQQDTVTQQTSLQGELVETLRESLAGIDVMVARGYVSEQEMSSRKERILEEKIALANIVQKSAALRSRIAQSRVSMQQLQVDSAIRMSALSSEISDLAQKKLELESRSSVMVTAPVSGTVSAIQVVEGAFADLGRPLMILLPANSKLQAHLYVPTRAIGFIRTGQEVRLLYEAFDYRRFGTYSGQVAEIASAALSPTDSSPLVHLAEPYYRVTVALAVQSIDAFGEKHPLQPGMQLHADIILEKRSIINWIFAPLLSLRGRT